MRSTNINSSITSTFSRIAGCLVNATSVLRHILQLTAMRELAGFRRSTRRPAYKCSTAYGRSQHFGHQSGFHAGLIWPTSAVVAVSVCPVAVAVQAARLDEVRRRLG
ncbi:MAG: hypothetical protein KF752_18510 [Pirellulaceae bacterium]|nr:hypothetical protein [Pirellulaceae bacterium]